MGEGSGGCGASVVARAQEYQAFRRIAEIARAA
jgi:hypothetical protein